MQDTSFQRTGVLFLHEGEAPAEWLREQLIASGCLVYTPRLEADGAKWLQAARRAWIALQESYPRVLVTGYALGGTLALLLAEEYPIELVAAIDAPVRLAFRRTTPGSRLPGIRRLITLCRRNLFAINARTLIVQAAGDRQTKPLDALRIYEGISSEDKQLFWLHASTHLHLAPADEAALLHEILNFLRT